MIKYLPPFMRRFTEIKELMKSEDKQISILNANADKVLKNAFIETADEEGISQYEKFLHIVSSEGENIEIRRTRVALRWNERIPYTYQALVSSLNTCLGKGNYTLYPDEEHYYIFVYLKVSVANRKVMVREIFERMVSAEIYYKICFIYNTHAVMHGFTHAQLHRYTQQQLREEVIE